MHGAGDLLANLPQLPPGPMGWMFSLTGSAPGYRLFKLATWLLVKDKVTLREWMLSRVDRDPPAMIVPAHGPPFAEGDVAAQTRTQLQRL